MYLSRYLDLETAKCSSQAATCYYQSNHSLVEAISLSALPKQQVSFGTASIFDFWYRSWGVARLLGLSRFPLRPHLGRELIVSPPTTTCRFVLHTILIMNAKQGSCGYQSL